MKYTEEEFIGIAPGPRPELPDEVFLEQSSSILLTQPTKSEKNAYATCINALNTQQRSKSTHRSVDWSPEATGTFTEDGTFVECQPEAPESWYVRVNENVTGPFSSSDVMNKYQNGELKPETELRHGSDLVFSPLSDYVARYGLTFGESSFEKKPDSHPKYTASFVKWCSRLKIENLDGFIAQVLEHHSYDSLDRFVKQTVGPGVTDDLIQRLSDEGINVNVPQNELFVPVKPRMQRTNR